MNLHQRLFKHTIIVIVILDWIVSFAYSIIFQIVPIFLEFNILLLECKLF